MSLIGLFFLFMYIGFCTIGGGLVAITLMQQELIPRGLISSEDFFAMVAISESTPGPMGINMATYIGYELYGVLGSVSFNYRYCSSVTGSYSFDSPFCFIISRETLGKKKFLRLKGRCCRHDYCSLLAGNKYFHFKPFGF